MEDKQKRRGGEDDEENYYGRYIGRFSGNANIASKEQGKEILIEGVIHEHEGFPMGLAVEKLEEL